MARLIIISFTSDSYKSKDGGCVPSNKSLYCKILPSQIPLNTTHLYIVDSKVLDPIEEYETLSRRQLYGNNWNYLKFLELRYISGIDDFALERLSNLEELHIFGEWFRQVKRNAFVGLNKLKVLRISGCIALDVGSFTEAIVRDVLGNLQALSMKDVSFEHANSLTSHSDDSKSEENLCVKMFKALKDKPVELINMKLVDTYELDIIQCIVLSDISAKLNISFSTFRIKPKSLHLLYFLLTNSLSYNSSLLPKVMGQSFQKVKDLKLLDASYISLPIITKFVEYALTLQNTVITVPKFIATFVSKAEIVNISGIYRHLNAVKLNNLSVDVFNFFFKSRPSPTKELIARNNRLQYLDVEFPCSDSKLEKLDLSSNVITFIRPNICLCCTKLVQINLSNNNLFEMVSRNYSLFGQLLSSYPSLKIVQLSFNNLTVIPIGMFNKNIYLEMIDLSNNDLPKITFNLKHLLNLKNLNLENNKISILDHMSLTNLHSLNARQLLPKNFSGILKMTGNPFLCSKCHDMSFTTWLASTPLINRNGNNIVCKNHEGINILADENAIKQLQEECDKPMWIRNVVILSTTIPIATATFLTFAICMLQRYRRRRIRRKNIEEMIELIQQNKLDTRFVVFLSYCSEDTDFMNKYIYNPLKIHLQEKLETEREVICLGDRHFQLGKPVNDEMVRTLQQSAVVLLLLSRNFCKSEFCRMEFDHALFMKKPFILMVKGEIDANEMVPSMQEMFMRNTRLLWEWDGETFVMKTSWDNIISSILELIK